MKNLIKELTRFASVGVLVTLLGLALMFLFYNAFHWGYWLSSALSYTIASVVSYRLNRSFTFRHQGRHGLAVLRFSLNIAACYGVAYGVARPLVQGLLQHFPMVWERSVVENIAMVLGNVIFTGLNFWGQKWFVFPKHKKQPSG